MNAREKVASIVRRLPQIDVCTYDESTDKMTINFRGHGMVVLTSEEFLLRSKELLHASDEEVIAAFIPNAEKVPSS